MIATHQVMCYSFFPAVLLWHLVIDVLIQLLTKSSDLKKPDKSDNSRTSLKSAAQKISRGLNLERDLSTPTLTRLVGLTLSPFVDRADFTIQGEV